VALLQNGYRDASSGVRYSGAGVSNNAYPAALHSNTAKTSLMRNLTTSEGITTALAGVPDGSRNEDAWLMPRSAGALSAYTGTVLTFSSAPVTLAEGRNIDGSTTLTFSVPSADLQLVVSATGTTSITFTNTGTLAGALSGTGTSAITFTVPTVTLGAVIDAIATASVTFSSSATARATGALAGDITPFTELSPQSLASAVWSQILESSLDAGAVMRLLLAVAAGKTDIDTSGPDPIVTFRDTTDSVNRVVATMTGSERTTVTLDGD
jgi:hypothetical protein